MIWKTLKVPSRPTNSLIDNKQNCCGMISLIQSDIKSLIRNTQREYRLLFWGTHVVTPRRGNYTDAAQWWHDRLRANWALIAGLILPDHTSRGAGFSRAHATSHWARSITGGLVLHITRVRSVACTRQQCYVSNSVAAVLRLRVEFLSPERRTAVRFKSTQT